jgi:hypothetical protein
MFSHSFVQQRALGMAWGAGEWFCRCLLRLPLSQWPGLSRLPCRSREFCRGYELHPCRQAIDMEDKPHQALVVPAFTAQAATILIVS